MFQSAGTARWAYNWTIARQEENFKNGGKFISNFDLRKELTILKQAGLPIIASNNIIKQAIKDACDAYVKFFKGLSKKPRFKSKRGANPNFIKIQRR